MKRQGSGAIVKRWVKISAALVLAIAVPATAQTFGFSLGAAEPACLPIGNATYRVTNAWSFVSGALASMLPAAETIVEGLTPSWNRLPRAARTVLLIESSEA